MKLNTLAAAFAASAAVLVLAGCEGDRFDRKLRDQKTAEMTANGISFMQRDKEVCAVPRELATLKGIKAVFSNRDDAMSRMIERLDSRYDTRSFNAAYRYEYWATSTHGMIVGSPEQVNKAAATLAKLDQKGIALSSFESKVADERLVNDYVAAVYQVREDGRKALNLHVYDSLMFNGTTIRKEGLESFMAQLEKGAFKEPGNYAIYADPVEKRDEKQKWHIEKIAQGVDRVEPYAGVTVTAKKIPQNLCLR